MEATTLIELVGLKPSLYTFSPISLFSFSDLRINFIPLEVREAPPLQIFSYGIIKLGVMAEKTTTLIQIDNMNFPLPFTRVQFLIHPRNHQSGEAAIDNKLLIANYFFSSKFWSLEPPWCPGDGPFWWVVAGHVYSYNILTQRCWNWGEKCERVRDCCAQWLPNLFYLAW